MNKKIKNTILSIILLLTLVPEFFNTFEIFGINYAYVIKPVLFCFICIIVFVFFKNEKIVNAKHKKDVISYVIIAALIYFFIYFGIGYVQGFAYSPYDNSIKGILLNLWVLLPVLISKEYSRYVLINNGDKKHVYLRALLISILFFILNINVSKLGYYFSSSNAFMRFVLEIVIPGIFESLYFTYICYYATYMAPIIYQIITTVIFYVLPIMPDISWILLSILSTSICFFSYIFINYKINKYEHTLGKNKYKTVDIKGWLAMITVMIIMICFGLGVFSYKPLVIATNSMKPSIHKGDLVLTKNINPNKLKVGDVVKYQLQNYYVVHRIKEIKQDKEGLIFVTKGDNNNDVDMLYVRKHQIKGIVKAKIRYVGYPTLLLGRLLNFNGEDNVSVETGN